MENKPRLQSFPPIADANSKILILGSMPGMVSLKRQEYYAHPQNAFWKIMERLFNVRFANDFNSKKAFLLEHHIALWDVLQSCEREGSTDAKIKNEIPNDITAFLSRYSNIKAVFCNGNKAMTSFKKHFPEFYPMAHLLPSTSPLHTVSFDTKLYAWKKIKDALED